MTKLIIGLLSGIAIGIVIAISNHPYERCSAMYDTPEDVMECVWILENE